MTCAALVSFAPHDRTRRVHRVKAEWEEKALGISRDECEKQLLEGEPRIAVLRHKRDPEGAAKIDQMVGD